MKSYFERASVSSEANACDEKISAALPTGAPHIKTSASISAGRNTASANAISPDITDTIPNTGAWAK